MRNLYTIFTIIAIISSSLLSSCRKMEEGQEIPAYIKIDKAMLSTIYEEDGASSSAFTDVWVEIDKQSIGAYELPAIIPVLKKGKHSVALRPGIKVNGMASTRTQYRFAKNIERENVLFEENKVCDLPSNLEFEYKSSNDYLFHETFERVGANIVSDTLLGIGLANGKEYADYSIVDVEESNAKPLDDRVRKVMKITLNKDKKGFAFRCNDLIKLNTTNYRIGQDILLEMDYKGDTTFAVLMVNNLSSGGIEHSLIGGTTAKKSKNSWVHVSFNLTPYMRRTMKFSDSYYFFLISKVKGETEQNIFIDNIKLIHL